LGLSTPFGAMTLSMGWMTKRALLISKIILGVLIIWSSLGVGELFEKIELMHTHFPLPKNDKLHNN